MMIRSFIPVLLLTLLDLSFADEQCALNHTTVEHQGGLEVGMTVTVATSMEGAGYLSVNFENGTFADVGDIRAWCVDIGRPIGNGHYSADIFSSLDPDVTTIDYPDAVDKPQFLPALNWMINEHPSGSFIDVPQCNRLNHMITDQEFQLTVWRVIDDHANPDRFWGNEDDLCVVEYLANKARQNVNYEMDCSTNTMLAILMIVDDDSMVIHNQVLIGEVNLRADTDVCDCHSQARLTQPPMTRPPMGGAHGDPHMVTWKGEKYDFHGICDLVLMSNPEFEENEGMDIHIRNHKMREWSYVEAATIRIGSDVLEVTGGKDNMNKVMMNGHIHEFENTGNGVEEMLTISGYPISFKKISNKAQEFVVDLGRDEAIIFFVWNSFVSIKVQNPSEENFGSSVGLMGSFSSGKKVARDNKTILDDVNEFGQEWQVNGDEPKLFHEAKGPQFPQKCEIPSSVEMRRRLEASKMTVQEAEDACAHVEANLKDLCMFDVMATSDESVAGSY